MRIRTKSSVMLLGLPAVLMTALFSTLFSVTFQKDYAKAQESVRIGAEAVRDSITLELSKGFELIRGVSANPVALRALNQMSHMVELSLQLSRIVAQLQEKFGKFRT